MKRRSFLTNFWLLGGSLVIPTVLDGCKKEETILTGKEKIEASLYNLQKTNQLETKLNKASQNYITLNNHWNCKTIFIVSFPTSSPKLKRTILNKFKTYKSLDMNVEGMIYKDKSQDNRNKLTRINLEGEKYNVKVYKKPRNISIPLNSPILGEKFFSYITTDMLNTSIIIQTIKL